VLRDLDALSDADVRVAYEQALMWFVGTVVGIDADRWNAPANDRFTVAELVGLAAHGCEQLLAHLDAPVAANRFVGRTGRTRAMFARPVPTMHLDLVDRAEDTLRALGPDVPAGVWRLGDRVLHRLAATADDAPCTTPLGTSRLVDELPRRVGELTVHTLDLGKAIGPGEPTPPPLPVEVTLSFVDALADPVKAILALTGRIGYDVFT
jgi:Mycothiol maleylpyruvate isomerase N-terminal domain